MDRTKARLLIVVAALGMTTAAVAAQNLTPYQPIGWSDKIVVSRTAGTNTDSTGLTTADTLYVDWAMANIGDTAITTTFYTYLYVDGVYRNGWYTSSLNALSYAYVLDYSIGALPAGTHTIKIVADATGVIGESNESDNQYTKTITVSPEPYPNLTPYTPDGWSDKIVVSRDTGTTTDSTGITSADTLYVDWAVINNGTGSTNATFYTYLYVDGTYRYSWSTAPPLAASSYTTIADYAIGRLSAGTHTLQIVTDTTGVIAESSEGDNQYTKTITVTSSTASNLTPYQPNGWSGKIVVSRETGTNTDSAGLGAADTLYVDWAVVNNGNTPTTSTFYTYLYVDGAYRTSWSTSSPLSESTYASVEDYSLGTLSAGTHTIQIVTDATSVIGESNEADNQYTKTINIAGTPSISTVSTSSKPPVKNQAFVFTISGVGFDPASSEVFFLGPGCATDTACVIPNGTLTTRTTTSLAGPATLVDGSFSLQVRNTGSAAVSNKKGLYVATQSGTSTPRALVLLVDFPDKPGQTAKDYFAPIMFGTYPAQAPRGSFRDYYKEVSYGKFLVEGAVNDATILWIRLPQPETYYAGGCYGISSATAGCSTTYPQNAQKMVEDAVTAAKNLGLDFGPFDADQDGEVDALFVFHAGVGAEVSNNTNDIWSHRWTTTFPVDTGSTDAEGRAVYVYDYSTEPEYRYSPGDQTMGVIAHEYGHARWDLPDLYDTDYTSQGVGNWSLMAGGSWNGPNDGHGGHDGSSPAHLDAWSKYRVGFVNPTKVTTALMDEPIAEAATAADVYQVLNGNAPAGTGEYFLVENRNQSGFDTYLPSSGLLIWHVDESQWTNDNENYPGCSHSVCPAGHYKVQLVPADNRWDLEKNVNRGDAGDPYPGVCGSTSCNTSFGNNTAPNSHLWSGQDSTVGVTNISAPGTNVIATISVGAPTLTVSLAPAAANGLLPLAVNLTASVGGTATGTVNYTFYCNRPDSGTNITTPYDGKFDAQSAISKSFTCNYGSAGTFIPKVIVERSSAPAAEARSSVIVGGPSVTINQAAQQGDPTTQGPIRFTVVFSEAVTGFSGSGVNVSGSAAFGSRSVVVTGSGTTYSVSVNGMTGSGTVIATVRAGAAKAVANNLDNQPSSSTDNVVTYTVKKRRGQVISN